MPRIILSVVIQIIDVSFFTIIVSIMIVNSQKRFHKGISLLIKITVFVFSFCFIGYKINSASDTINFSQAFEHTSISYLVLASVLMFVNWALEAIKWKLLISKFEQISLSKSMISVLSGITIGIFTPNRLGEFAGRIFCLEKADKLKATISSAIGSSFQLFLTVLAGISGYYVLEMIYEDYFQITTFISTSSVVIIFSLTLLSLSFLAFVYLNRNKRFLKYKEYIEVISQFSLAQLLFVFLLSFLRYSVFSFQYYLMLKYVGMNAAAPIFFSLIALTLLVTSVIPTFALSEILVRSAAAVYFFGPIFPNSAAILMASLLLWFVNLAIPAMFGTVFIWKLKFFK